MRWISFAAALLAFVAVGPAFPQGLWNGSTYGMTLGEVKAQFPHAEQPDKPDHVAGATELLRLEGIALVKKKFRASFYFYEGKLIQVTLQLDGDHSYDEAQLIFKSLVQELRGGYGKEVELKANPGPVVKSAHAVWIYDQTNVEIALLGVVNTPAMLNVNFTAIR